VAKTSITDLLEAGVHFGHQTKRWNPKMKPYVYGARNGITIFDLTNTMRRLAEACTFLSDTVADGGHVLFVGAKRQAQEAVREIAERTGMYFMCDRWLGGTLTNHRVVLSRVAHMKKLQTMEADGTTAKMPKKEVASLRRERSKLERTLGGIAEMKKLPAALVVVDVGRETIAVREANKLDIPVVAIVDSNCDPDPIDYVIPGNDDALRAIKVIVDALANSIEEGLQLGGKGGTVASAPVPQPAPVPPPPPAEAEAEAPAEGEAPTEGEAPAEAQAPAEGEPPAEVETPAEAEAEAEAPAEGEPPAEAEAPAEGEAPTGAEPPAEAEPQAEAEPPAEAETPAEAEASPEPADDPEAAPAAPEAAAGETSDKD